MRHFFQVEFVFFTKKNTNCKKFQKVCREKFRAQVFRKYPNSKKISKKFQKILDRYFDKLSKITVLRKFQVIPRDLFDWMEFLFTKFKNFKERDSEELQHISFSEKSLIFLSVSKPVKILKNFRVLSRIFFSEFEFLFSKKINTKEFETKKTEKNSE